MTDLNKIMDQELKTKLQGIQNYEGRFMYDDWWAVLVAAWRDLNVNGGVSSSLDVQTLINRAITTERDSERKYTDALVTPVSLRLTAIEQQMSKNDHNIASNQALLQADIHSAMTNLQGLKQALNDFKTKMGVQAQHHADITDQMENQIITQRNILKMLVDHMPKDPKIVERPWLYGVGIGQQLHTNTKWDLSKKYVYDYYVKGIKRTTRVTNSDIEIGDDAGNVGLTPLIDGIGLVIIWEGV